MNPTVTIPTMRNGLDSHADLNERHRAEAAFHDEKYTKGDSFPRHYRANPTYPVFVRMLNQLGADLSGLRVLEYGCGTGWITVELAKRGAQVSAFDISSQAVAQTTEVLKGKGLLPQCSVRVMGGEKLDYEDGKFDLAVGFAILHHLAITPALAELHRVLKPGGRALFAEPLGSNPLINLYRRLTPQFRTANEVPIDLMEFQHRASAFAGFEHHDQLLLASAALALCYVPGLSAAATSTERFLMRADDVILKIAPWAGRWAWYSILVMEK